MKRLKIIGLTGQSGAGKSSAARIFKENGISVVNADLLVKELYESGSPCVKTIAGVFGSDVIDEKGFVIRPLLAERAFSTKENTALLSSIVHPFVMAKFLEISKSLTQNGEKFIVYDAPQLFESNADVICDCIVSVVADRKTRIERICSRDNIDVQAAEMRINAQFNEEFFKKNSDYIIENNGSLELLKNKCQKIYNKLNNVLHLLGDVHY